jgi:Preprotein translocase subunit SecD
MICAKCGTHNAQGQAFCFNCGNSLDTSATAPPQQYNYNPQYAQGFQTPMPGSGNRSAFGIGGNWAFVIIVTSLIATIIYAVIGARIYSELSYYGSGSVGAFLGILIGIISIAKNVVFATIALNAHRTADNTKSILNFMIEEKLNNR